jgi:1-phosphatidylinositol-3-phosphate 5-kinase
MLVYSSHLCELSSELCEHTNINTELPTVPNDTLPPSRFSIVRFFGYGSRSVSFSLSRVEDIFELRVPQLQIIKSNVPEKPTRTSEQATVEEEEEKRELRNEIKIWWQGIADHLDKLVR